MPDLGKEGSEAREGRPAASLPTSWSISRTACCAILALVCLVPAFLPAETLFVNDEPQLVRMALDANAEGRLASRGIAGSKGITYGPFSVWFYQLYLLLSHRLVGLVVVHALFITLVTAAALLWLQRELSLWPWFAVPLLLSPHVWFFARAIWDNPFNIPMSALLLAAAARLLRAPTAWAAALLSFSMAALVLTHFMGLAPVMGVIAALVLLRPRVLWGHRIALVLGALPLVVAAYPYWAMIAAQKPGNLVPWSSAWFFPFGGPRFISAAYIERYFGTGWIEDGGWFVAAARAATLVAYPLCLAGAGLTVMRIVRARRLGSKLPVREAFGLLLLVVFFSQVLLDGLVCVKGSTAYLTPIWLVFGMFAWFAAEAVRPKVARALLVSLYGVSLAVVVIALGRSIHVAGGSRAIYGPTIGNQMELAEALRSYPADTPVRSEVPNLLRFPHAFRLIRDLTPPRPDAAPPAGDVWIRYRSSDPRDARLEVVVVPPPSAP